MIGIIDYGLGNLFSIHNALKSVNISSNIITSPEQISEFDRLILPGVGAFPEGMKHLKEKGFIEILKNTTKPILGICLGMQLLFEEGDEFCKTEGLGLIPGRVVSIEKPSKINLKIPHMGWNKLEIIKESSLSKSLEGNYVYFVHSYKVFTKTENIIAICDYGQPITAIVEKNNVFGTQFHPEKSGDIGIRLLKNFANISI
ncbi:MAG: imidazole glycerol phosphate synthase subunit HisH [Clostridia bacterium]